MKFGLTSIIDITHRRLPIPPGVDVLLSEQEVVASDDSVVDQVLAADVTRTLLLKEEADLLILLEKNDIYTSSSQDIDAELELEELEREDVKDIKTADASVENEYCEEMSHDELIRVVERLQVLGAELEAIGAYGREAKVRRILTGLGFSESMQVHI